MQQCWTALATSRVSTNGFICELSKMIELIRKLAADHASTRERGTRHEAVIGITVCLASLFDHHHQLDYQRPTVLVFESDQNLRDEEFEEVIIINNLPLSELRAQAIPRNPLQIAVLDPQQFSFPQEGSVMMSIVLFFY
jgi:hypothetical protein